VKRRLGTPYRDARHAKNGKFSRPAGSPGWTYDEDLRLLGRHKGRPNLQDLRWLGLTGELVRLLNHGVLGGNLAAAFARDGWPGLLITLVRDDRIPAESARDATLQVAIFSGHRWVIDKCSYPRPHPVGGALRGMPRPALFPGTHLYVRPIRGRRPEACHPVQQAARDFRRSKQRRAKRLLKRRKTDRR
jgi:hypothetical protein